MQQLMTAAWVSRVAWVGLVLLLQLGLTVEGTDLRLGHRQLRSRQDSLLLEAEAVDESSASTVAAELRRHGQGQPSSADAEEDGDQGQAAPAAAGEGDSKAAPAAGGQGKGGDVVHKGRKTADKLVSKTKGDLANTWNKAENVDEVDDEVVVVWRTLLARFLPKFEFKEHIFFSASALVVTAVLVFIVFVLLIMQTDRESSLKRWEKMLEAKGIYLKDDGSVIHMIGSTPEELAASSFIQPEIIIQFHHPGFKQPDADTVVRSANLDAVIVDGKSWDHVHFLFNNLRRTRTIAQDRSARDTPEGVSGAASHFIGQYFGTPPPEDGAITRKDVRAAVLQDVYQLLVTLGCNVMVFASADRDEIFLGVNLQRREVIRHYLTRDHYTLQLKSSVVKGLGIEQDPQESASSPPFVPYDPRLVKRVHKAGIIDVPDEQQLYQEFPAPDGHHIVSFLQRSMIIYKELNEYIHMNEAIHSDFILNYYPVHHPQRVKELKATWASFWHLLDLSFVQPMGELHRYFGPGVSLIFAWTGNWSKCLVPLVALGLAWGILVRVTQFMGFKKEGLDEDQVIGFSIVLMLWAKMADNLWERERQFLVESWGMEGGSGGIANKIKRSEFFGEMAPSPVDSSVEEKQYPIWKMNMRRMTSAGITLLIATQLLGFYQVFMLVFMEDWSVVTSVLLAGMMKVFELVFKMVVKKLTDFENHKYEEDYYNSYVWKSFLFEFVNNYSAFFFIAFTHEKDSRKCPQNDCLFDLRLQLSVALSVLALCSIAQLVVYVLMVKWAKYKEMRDLAAATGTEIKEHSYLEEQSKYLPYTEIEQINTLLPLVLSLGHAFLFGAIAPIVVTLCLVVFAVHLRVSAFMMVTTYQRVFPKPVKDLGVWVAIVKFLMVCGLIFSSFLFVAYGETFSRTTMRAKLTGAILYCVGLMAAWGLVNVYCPSSDSFLSILQERRSYVLHKLLMCRSKGGNEAGGDSFEVDAADVASVAGHHKEVQEGLWEAIPTHAELVAMDKKQQSA
eukprot:TRINITY_DN29524_c0_g1_i1.p1 TRINITY_DN29524_c0_g1~~TRINITY_DN29524_c0_g1_i1.p1  ORF type:complete len:1011 (-),score=307.77 TRINITY_DN29524_c0_g1_i1:86-3118(-)